jgi:hypothetical protein
MKMSRFIALFIAVSTLVLITPLPTFGTSQDSDISGMPLSRYERAIAWLFAIEIDHQNRAHFNQAFLNDWQTSTPAERANYPLLVDVFEKAMSGEALEGEFLRLKLREDLLTSVRKQPEEPLAQFLLREDAIARPPITVGTPALTRDASDAFFSILIFILSNIQGIPEPALPEEAKNQAAATLSAKWPTMSTEQKQNIIAAPLKLAALRYRWNTLPDRKKESLRAGWKRQLGHTQIAAQSAGNQVLPAEAAAGNSAGNPTNGVAQAKRNVPKRSPTAHDLEIEARRSWLMSLAQQQLHQTNTAIISNINGPGWEYRIGN